MTAPGGATPQLLRLRLARSVDRRRRSRRHGRRTATGPLNTANPSPSRASRPARQRPSRRSPARSRGPTGRSISTPTRASTRRSTSSPPQTGIQVQYHEDINDNSEFFGKIQPDLQAGRSTGYDMITPSDWMVAKLIRFGYLQPLDKSLLPNWTANAQDVLKNPWYDPGNTYSIPWQAGIVGIAYNPKLTGRDITSFDDLLDPAFAGRSGLFSEMIDTMSLTLLSDGVHPEDATMDDVVAAQQKLLAAAQAGQFRAFYGNDYYDALAAGDLAVTMAWSGDISQMQLYDNPDVKFVIPEHGRPAVRRQHGHPQLRRAPGRRVQADGLLVHARGGRAADRVHRLLQPGQGRAGGRSRPTRSAARPRPASRSRPTT